MSEIEQISSRLSVLEARVSEMKVESARADLTMVHIDKRLASIEETQKWIVRLIIGALLLGLVGFALGGGLDLPR